MTVNHQNNENADNWAECFSDDYLLRQQRAAAKNAPAPIVKERRRPLPFFNRHALGNVAKAVAGLVVTASAWSAGEMGVNAISKKPAPGYEPETSLLSRYVTGIFNLRRQIPQAMDYVAHEAEQGYENSMKPRPPEQN